MVRDIGCRWAKVLLGGWLLVGLQACASTQRFPQPMPGPDNLPPGASDLFPEGPEQALVLRHGDTVHVKHAGEDSIFQLRHYDKQVRVQAGAAVLTDASGRAEIVFPRESRAGLFGTNVVVLGSPSRGEPLIYIVDVDIIELMLDAGEYVVLPGGSQVSGPGGPYVVEQYRDDILVLRNRAPEIATVRYRDATFELNPGEVVHLPRMEVGSAPIALDAAARPVPIGDAVATLWGDLEVVQQDGQSLVIEAGVDPTTRPHEVRAFGLLIRLDANQRVVLEEFSMPSAPGGIRSTGPDSAGGSASPGGASDSATPGTPEGNQL